MTQIHTAMTMVVKGPGSGGIPDYRVDRKEYSAWQNDQIRRLKEDLHPDNRGKTSVTSESWAPRDRVEAVREGRGN
jgi:hypothetical protein